MTQDETKMNIDGTIRAKVLQYKRDGNTLTEKWETLTKLCDGVYYNRDQDAWNNWLYVFFYEDNGVFWFSQIASSEVEFNRPEARERIIGYRKNFRVNLKERAKGNNFINTLQIEVMRRLGEDIAPLVASREAFLKHREEEERQKAEETARREQQRKEAEERRRDDLLIEGKEKLLSYKAITVEQIELIAEAVGYTIHGRTLGFMREKVSEVILKEDETVTVWGRKLTQRNINGTADVVRELAERVKAQAEAETQQPATATETPQISTEEPEMANVSAEEEKRGIMHISEIIETCRLHDETGEETDEWKYYQWLASVNHGNYQTIADKALTEAWTNIFLAAYRRGKGHVLAMNDHGELVDTVFVASHPEPTDNPGSVTQTARNTPQPPEAQPAQNYAITTQKRHQRPQKTAKSRNMEASTPHATKSGCPGSTPQHHFTAAGNMLHGKFTATMGNYICPR